MTLIEKLEAAEGPSQELDREIWLRAVASKDQIKMVAIGRKHFGDAEANDRIDIMSDSRSYTASIDTALTLVPEEMRDEISITTLHCVARVAINLNHAPDDGPYYGSSEYNSIPIALCIAALRARGQ